MLPDDYRSACENNGEGARMLDTARVLYETIGENEYKPWHWLIEFRSGGYAYVIASCDYTGWDCQSEIEFFDARTLAGALQLAPIDVRLEWGV